MASSGTTLFAPSVADLSVEAYLRCGVKPPSLTPQHFISARLNSNLLLDEWSNEQPHLWKVDLLSVPLLDGVATYALPQVTILTLDVYISQTSNGVTLDRFLYPVSRDDYASYPNKATEAPPAVYWFDRTITPSITFYPTPDADDTYVCKIYRVIQTDDMNPAGAQTPDMPGRFRPAFTAGLAARLSETYAPQLYDALEARHQQRYLSAIRQDQEMAAFELTPDLSSYYNR